MSSTHASRILVIDDDEATLIVVRKLLEATGVFVDVSPSANDALVRLSESRYDVILCDMWMPGMSGKDFYDRLRKEFPDYQNRTVILTGDLASETTWEFIEGNGLPYVLKPISPNELRRRLEEVIGPEVGAEEQEGPEKRRHERVRTKAHARVRKESESEDLEIAEVDNASKEGVYFLTTQQYRVGTEVVVSFPYPEAADVWQGGYVVRVSERGEGRRGVAIALGGAASAIRGVLGAYEGEATVDVADVKLQLARSRDEARHLMQELADLKTSYERVVAQREQLAAEKSHLELRLRERTK